MQSTIWVKRLIKHSSLIQKAFIAFLPSGWLVPSDMNDFIISQAGKNFVGQDPQTRKVLKGEEDLGEVSE